MLQCQERLLLLPAAERVRHAAAANRYLRDHLIGLRRVFDGDALLALLIGEIAHRNVCMMAHASEDAAARGASNRWSAPT